MKKSKAYIFRTGATGRARRRNIRSGVTEERRTMRRVRVQQARRTVRMS